MPSFLSERNTDRSSLAVRTLGFLLLCSAWSNGLLAADAPPPDNSRHHVDASETEVREPAGPPVNLNLADAHTLATQLPGIGPVKAAAIVAWRDQFGGFGSVEQLIEVKGVGPVTLEKVRALLAVGVSTAPPMPGRSALISAGGAASAGQPGGRASRAPGYFLLNDALLNEALLNDTASTSPPGTEEARREAATRLAIREVIERATRAGRPSAGNPAE